MDETELTGVELSAKKKHRWKLPVFIAILIFAVFCALAVAGISLGVFRF